MTSTRPPDQEDRFDQHGPTEPEPDGGSSGGSDGQTSNPPTSEPGPQPSPHSYQGYAPQPLPERQQLYPTYPTYPSYQSSPTQQTYQPAQPTPSFGQPPEPHNQRRGLAPWLLPVLVVIAIILVAVGVGVGLALSRSGSAANTVGAIPAATVPVAPAAQDLQQQVVNVIRTVQPSVVQVQSQGGQGQAIGSGEIVSSDGYIVTNDHVVTGFSQYSVLLSNGATYSATLVGEDPQDDLAVLKITPKSSLPPIAFGDSSQAQVGQFVVALGSPLGLQQSATFGIVSALNRSASEGMDGPARELTGLIQTSAPINPGNSGGALVNLSGQLIGLPTLGALDPTSGGAASGIGFAIPSNRVKFVMGQLIKNGHLVTSGQGFLGIEGKDVTPQLASADNLGTQSGVEVADFANAANGSSPAQAAGLQKGDVITAVNGQTVNNSNDLASALIPQHPGSQVKITYVRGSSTNTVNVTLGERPTNAG